ncbi:oxygen-insensitive NAD(P)H nitroreductase [Erythrobacter mangrovi]|uniref:Oxygen-insensitive NAD(P)H nitroreductase n=1 Tax=Erythrobacter mangrovi TaxID=2739433 RepID=A0A7D3XGK1_9SPHN|nr:oxygen-insensitive NAD(P)H nitroreductase [Erythrobacter mangrovi]QKG70533.1 oxygen-insensitive NAD(P)H nitroreductase [Erythrobacter mangrovi]
MTELSPLVRVGDAIVATAKSRHTAKAYDITRRIPDEDIQGIKDLLRFSPSSTNSQPWHFVIVGTEEGKALVAKAAEDAFAFNKPKITDASHIVIFASRNTVDEDYLRHLLDREIADGRFVGDIPTLSAQLHAGRSMFVNMHRDAGDLEAWTQAQTYLNMGQFMLGVAAMGIDATAMEGVDTDVLDIEFGLREKGFRSLVAVSLGYRSEDDFNARLPKSRLFESEVFTEV